MHLWRFCGQWRSLGASHGLASQSQAAIAELGERHTEDLKVPGSIPGLGKFRPRSTAIDNLAYRALGLSKQTQDPSTFRHGCMSVSCMSCYSEICSFPPTRPLAMSMATLSLSCCQKKLFWAACSASFGRPCPRVLRVPEPSICFCWALEMPSAGPSAIYKTGEKSIFGPLPVQVLLCRWSGEHACPDWPHVKVSASLVWMVWHSWTASSAHGEGLDARSCDKRHDSSSLSLHIHTSIRPSEPSCHWCCRAVWK